MKKVIIWGMIYVFVLVVIIPPLAVFLTSGKRVAKGEEPFKTVLVYIKSEDRVEEMDTSQYLKEVVGAEMPASFSYEALKAQAVAARTYLCSKKENDNNDEHKGATVCTDYTHCKAWLKESDRKAQWEEDKREEYWDKVSKAVEETAGEILTYNGKPISAVFHSTSSGKTENAGDVWEKDVPYLRSVESRGDELSPKFYSEFRCSEDEFKTLVEQNIDKTYWNNGLYSGIVRSDAGGIIKITLGGVEVKGSTFRTIFGLRSANAELEQEGNEIIMKVKGYGHGVGMSQYGADFMGSNGNNYEEILKYYYQGVELISLTKT